MRLAERLSAILQALSTVERSGVLTCSTDSTFYVTLIRSLRECHDQAWTLERGPLAAERRPTGEVRIELDRVVDAAKAHLTRKSLLHPNDLDHVAAALLALHEALTAMRTKGTPS